MKYSQQGAQIWKADKFETWLAQAKKLYLDKNYNSVIELCQKKLLPIASRNMDVLLLLGTTYYHVKEFQLAEKYLAQATKVGANAAVYSNLGLTLAALNRRSDAEKAFRQAVEIEPRHISAWNNLGNLLQGSHRLERRKEAIHCYEKLIAIKPDYADAYSNLASALERNLDYEEAEKNYRLAISFDPHNRIALGNLAKLLEKNERPGEALEYYRQAIAIQPRHLKTLGNAFGLRRSIADWDPEGIPQIDALLSVLHRSQSSVLPPLPLLSLPEVDAETLRIAARNYARLRWHEELAQPPLVSSSASLPKDRLRIGYISADFRNHPVAHLVADVIAAHDRGKFEIFLYAHGPSSNDEKRRVLQEVADRFIPIDDMEDYEAAKRIREDGIDILVDLTAYTQYARSGINALRPATVIASWIGYVGTLGEPRMADYIIGDAVVTPPEHSADFSETLALMPECFQPNCALFPLPPAPSRADENLPDNAVVFCSFNQIFKLTPQLWDDWCRILQAVPESILWLPPVSLPIVEQNLRREAALRGVVSERLVFAQRKSLDEHRARIALADIALDTFPYNSGATASDALRAGVPLITRMGRTFASRMAASLLHTIGLPELIADDREEYAQLAISLAQHAGRRAQIRNRLAKLLPETSLFKPRRFARQLEALFQEMHEQARTGQRRIITVPHE